MTTVEWYASEYLRDTHAAQPYTGVYVSYRYGGGEEHLHTGAGEWRT